MLILRFDDEVKCFTLIVVPSALGEYYTSSVKEMKLVGPSFQRCTYRRWNFARRVDSLVASGIDFVRNVAIWEIPDSHECVDNRYLAVMRVLHTADAFLRNGYAILLRKTLYLLHSNNSFSVERRLVVRLFDAHLEVTDLQVAVSHRQLLC